MRTFNLIILLCSLFSTEFMLGKEVDSADIDITISGYYPSIGHNETFTITARNNGPNTAENVIVNLSNTSCFSFTSSNCPNGNFSNNMWTIGTLNNGDVITMTAVYLMNSMCSCSYLFIADITSTTNDPNSFNNNSLANYNWDITTDFELQCSPVNNQLTNGSTIYIDYLLKNNYPTDACSELIFFDNIGGLTIVNAIPSTGVWHESQKYWELDSFVNNNTYSIQFQCLIEDVNLLSMRGQIILLNDPWEINQNNNICSTTFTNLSNSKNDFTNDIIIYPNPINDIINIDFGKKMENISISIKNILGQIITTKSFSQIESTLYPITGESGIYFIIIEDENHHQKTFKIIKK